MLHREGILFAKLQKTNEKAIAINVAIAYIIVF